MYTNVSVLQEQDPFWNPIICYLKSGQLPQDEKEVRRILHDKDSYFLYQGILYHIWFVAPKKNFPGKSIIQLCVPRALKSNVLKEFHDSALSAHFGNARTLSKIRLKYYWWGMAKDISEYIRSCTSCAQRKNPKIPTKPPLIPLPVVGVPFERISMDILGPLPVTKDNNKYVLCFSDHCTRWPILVAIPDIKSETVADVFYNQVICQHGCPRYVLSDRGANFLSEVMHSLYRLMRIRKLNTAPYKPSTDGLQERFNRVICDTLSHFVDNYQSNWDAFLPSISFAYRSTPADNVTGYSPFFLLYGREPTMPLDVSLLPSEERVVSSKQYVTSLVNHLETVWNIKYQLELKYKSLMKSQYDKKQSNIKFQVGDKVWLYIPKVNKGLTKKLAKQWSGPYLLVKQTSPVNFRVRNVDNHKMLHNTINVGRMKLFFGRNFRPDEAVIPGNPVNREDLDGLCDDDLPPDSFVSLKSKRKVDKAPVLPFIQDPGSDETFEVERVLRGRTRPNGVVEYLIKWVGYKTTTWEPIENLNASCLDYIESNKIKAPRVRR